MEFTEKLREINPGSPTSKAVMMLQSNGSLRSEGHRESLAGGGIGSIMKEKERRGVE